MPLENAARTAYDLKRFRDASLLYEQLLRLVAEPRSTSGRPRGRSTSYELEDRPDALRCFRRALLLETDAAEKAKLDALVRELGG